ncbi:MAG: transcriptional regulator with XRE-family HTH domain [Candidatus Deianiraeaceae bacterium]|jgi:transcriptional regulator with XRE-family HTH domain
MTESTKIPRKRGQKIAPSKIDQLIGMRIRIARNMSSKNQETLAQRLGVTLQQIQKYENGKNKISVNTLTQISEYFNIPIIYFIPNKIGTVEENTQETLQLFNQNPNVHIAEEWKPIGGTTNNNEDGNMASDDSHKIILQIMETIIQIKDHDKQKEAIRYLKTLQDGKTKQ